MDPASFLIQVQFRQNATWQGILEWVEGGRRDRFSSDLEFLKLLERDLRQSVDKEEQKRYENADGLPGRPRFLMSPPASAVRFSGRR